MKTMFPEWHCVTNNKLHSYINRSLFDYRNYVTIIGSITGRVQDYLDSKTRYRNDVITFWVITPLKRNAPF